ncbi:hypothetical protein QJ054_32785 [Streptomyces sp. AN-3]|nr:hypothetical protein [Streptomyces sp. AN-3]MDI3101822.1 hypothetical protein [Streptomyces sp. AN-3]
MLASAVTRKSSMAKQIRRVPGLNLLGPRAVALTAFEAAVRGRRDDDDNR